MHKHAPEFLISKHYPTNKVQKELRVVGTGVCIRGKRNIIDMGE